jgi:hypothetical protein
MTYVLRPRCRGSREVLQADPRLLRVRLTEHSGVGKDASFMYYDPKAPLARDLRQPAATTPHAPMTFLGYMVGVTPASSIPSPCAGHLRVAGLLR